MPKIQYDQETEVIGQSLLSYIDNIQSDSIKPLLAKHGLEDIQPDQWYRLQPLLDTFDELATMPNFSSNMIAAGMKLAHYATLVEALEDVSLNTILEHWHESMYANHRNGNIGEIITEKVSDTYYRTIHRNVYPDDLSYGLAFGFARAKLPKGTSYKVWYENENNRLGNGDGEETIICISWE